jgi:hypothetical protein
MGYRQSVDPLYAQRILPIAPPGDAHHGAISSFWYSFFVSAALFTEAHA